MAQKVAAFAAQFINVDQNIAVGQRFLNQLPGNLQRCMVFGFLIGLQSAEDFLQRIFGLAADFFPQHRIQRQVG